MPWAPELFSAPVLAQLEQRAQRKLITVPYFEGFLTGELDALIGSFADEPEVHHPVRGRVKGVRAFEALVRETSTWLKQNNVSVDDVEHLATERGGLGEFVLSLEGEGESIHQPVAVIADFQPDRRIRELRIYSSSWPLTRQHPVRPPLSQPDPELREPDVVAEYCRALSAGDVEPLVEAFEPDGYAREPAGASTSTEAMTPCATSTDGGSRTTAESHSRSAASSTTGARVRSSTTWCGGARRSYRRTRAWRS